MSVLGFDIRLRVGDFDLEVAEDIPLQGITAVTGPSGSGKTTLLRALAGLETAGQAYVNFDGADWSVTPPHERGIGFVFQDARLFDHLDVAGNLAFGARRRKVDQAHVDAVVAALDLGPLMTRAPGTLSGGEARRVALGRALAAAPRILFLDEPLSGLDPERKDDMLDAICNACTRFAIPALLVSHDRSEVQALARRELRVVGGRSQGWAAMPPQLVADVVSGGGGVLRVTLAGEDLSVPGRVAGDRRVAFVLSPGTFLVSAADPGPTSGRAVFPVRLTSQEDDGSGVVTFADGQRAALPAGEIPQGCRPGDALFLTLANTVVPRRMPGI